MGIPQGWEFILLLLVLLLLFGAKRLPDTARGLGRSLRILKAETRGLRDEDAPAGPHQPETRVLDTGAEGRHLPPVLERPGVERAGVEHPGVERDARER
ncbi:MAG: Sec-independent protein translocase subunit TatA [Actinomycetota bacterium]|nr:Sec-independent protein translocase subunit TatA [Actinomycetota bacterium]